MTIAIVNVAIIMIVETLGEPALGDDSMDTD